MTAARLPKPPAGVPASNDLSLVAPRFRAAVERVLDRMRKLGFDAVVFEAVRTPERQAFLWGFGREYDDGRGIVTHAPTAWRSWHVYGLAVDIISDSKGWNAPEAFWDALGAAARAEHLTWGGDWHGEQCDRPHVQWGLPMRDTPSWRAKKLRDEGGNQAVWREVLAGG